MKKYKQMTWQHEITGMEGNAILFGTNIFEYDWQEDKEPVSGILNIYNTGEIIYRIDT